MRPWTVLCGAVLAVAGQWFHLAVAVGDNGCTLYVDGRRVADKQGALHPDDLRATKGYLGYGMGGGYMAGRLSSVAFFTRMLTDAEIATLKEKGQL
ncbi:MAG: hypothetical protein NTW87_00460 [Planctomycetota bacterium]|nr:hypothetical protein [Planctomycetota bacterium]